jgi:hypothetical protein
VRHIKIYPSCNFEVNPITHFGVISLFLSNFQNFNTFRPLFQKLRTFFQLKLTFISYSFLKYKTKIIKFLQISWKKVNNSKMGNQIYFQWKPNLVWIITRISSFKIVSGDAVHQPTWPLLLKIEHMVKLQVWKKGNNSKMSNGIYFKIAG